MDGDNREAWTPWLAKWNTIGTLAGALVGFAALVVWVVTLVT